MRYIRTVESEEFEWDDEKERANIAKHDINFRTAAEVFSDPFIFEYEDNRSYDEIRWNAIGRVDRKLLHVTYTERGNVTRIISAREAESRERRKYYNAI